MHIISNTSGLINDIQICSNEVIPSRIKNHKELIETLIIKSNKIVIASPYLMKDFEDFFSTIDISNKEFELITTCAPRGDEQINKPSQLYNFGKTIKASTNKWPNIHLIQSLHSKIYLFYKDNIKLCGIITSANFTSNGLVYNHETGIITTVSQTLESLENELESNLDFVSLSEYQINELCIISEKMKNEKRYEPQENIDIRLEKNLEKICTPSSGNRDIKLRSNANFYIKVSGVRDRPILPKDRKKINQPHSDLDFAKEPKTMKLGDCLIEVAVGGMCFLNYYSLASKVFERTEEEKKNNIDYIRWPYYVYANNLSLHFGEKWFESPLYYDDIIKDFKNEYPTLCVTPSGKDSIKGAIQMGHSYIKVTKEFGEFVKTIIDNQ